ncbi:HD domain-containing protein [Fulvitalea axinellae]|uniref:HD domain-containing protein n=1 Tax=Fulvitalea axinellae TaxID=1182444 RepID=UPI0030CA3B11
MEKNENRLQKQLEFIREIDKVKYIQRKTRLFESKRHENDAEHSWHLAMMCLTLAEHADEKFDTLRTIKMVLIHDLVEIDAGDTFLFDAKKDHVNTKDELRAAKRIFGLLPKDQADEMISVWQEFEEGKTPEARFAKAMDRFEPALQNESNGGGTWKEYGIGYSQIKEKLLGIRNGSLTIWRYTQELLRKMVVERIISS